MNLDLQFKLKSNPLYLRFLHENSYWYKYLNRSPSYFNDFIEDVKVKYKLRPSDKIDKAISTFDMISSIITTLNSN
ncbi:MAG: hypothetical protein Q4E75_06105 [bacterium]|nr:hypothetical protein [bacterium]